MSYQLSNKKAKPETSQRAGVSQLRHKPVLQDNRKTTVQRNNTGLPDDLKSGMESLSGVNLDSVRVHYNSPKPAAVQAHAYAQGSHIHLASGQEKHLPHELGHVVQQAQGKVSATTTVAGVAVNDSAQLENEATQMGHAALQRKVSDVQFKGMTTLPGSQNSEVAQRFWMRNADAQEPHWEDDRYKISTALVHATVPVVKEYGKRNKRGNRKKRTVHQDEKKRNYPLFGELTQVYKKAPDVNIDWATLKEMVDTIGLAKVRAILAGDHGWRQNRGTPLLRKHLNFFETMDIDVLRRMMAQNYTVTRNFLQRVSAAQMKGYFQNAKAQQLAQVTGGEFAAFVSAIGKEQEMPLAEMSPLAPTTGQGAHHVSEHGAHSTTQQTIERAVLYAFRRGNANATKGNWVSHLAANAAMNHANREVSAQVSAARADNTRTVAVLNAVPPPNGIFGTNAFRANVRAIISQGQYEHGNTTGAAGAAVANLSGNFVDSAGAAHAGAITGNFTGSITGPLATGANLAATNVDNLNFSGNGVVDADIHGRTVLNAGRNQLDGTVFAQTEYASGHVNIRLGLNHFDGIGRFHTPMDGQIASNNTSWTAEAGRIGGWVNAETGNQRVNVNGTGSGSLTSELMRGGYYMGGGVGVNLTGNKMGYSNGVRNLSNVDPKVNTMRASVAGTAMGGSGVFRPRSLQDIVRNATLTAKKLHYTRTAGGGPAAIDAPLLENSVMVNGTLAQLQASGAVPHGVGDLASLRLQVNNVRLVRSSVRPDVRAAGTTPVVGDYQITLSGQIIEFRLANLSNTPGNLNFRVLMKLKNDNNATYKPFTAY